MYTAAMAVLRYMLQLYNCMCLNSEHVLHTTHAPLTVLTCLIPLSMCCMEYKCRNGSACEEKKNWWGGGDERQC